MVVRSNLAAFALLTGVVFGQGSVGDNPIGSRPAPIPVHRVDPKYTDEARKAKIEGAVLLKCVVNEDGIPTTPEVVRSLDKGLDAKAIEALMQWRFKPALKYGKPVPISINVEINFRLLK